jgi:hypothetical protein
MEALGDSSGQAALQTSETDHVVVLSFGDPGVSGGYYGAWMVNGKGFVSTLGASGLAQLFAASWLNRTANTPHHLWLAFGVNSHGTGVTQANAQSWAFALYYARFSVQDPRLTFIGALDAENATTSGWNTAATTRAWVDAYMNGQNGCTPGQGINACLYNFGSANCGYSSTNQYCGYADWYKDDIWYISAGAKRSGDSYPFVAALPEIYNTSGANARQWQSVSLYGVITPGKRKLYFVGPMTEKQACDQVVAAGGSCTGIDNPPSTGYSQLYYELSKDTRTAQSPIPWSTDIKYQVYP